MIPLLVAVALMLQPADNGASTLGGKLPATWPPPGWPTAVCMPGQPGATDSSPSAAATIPEDKWVAVLPHVRINRSQRAVEFDGTVAWDFHNPDTPRTELELLVCLPLRDKEHESLVVSKATGAHVHAALLMVGLEPGTPGRIDFGEGTDVVIKRVPPTGPAVSVAFVYAKGGAERVDDARTWVVDEADGGPISLVFGGSKVGQKRNEARERVNVYNADELGTLIGLCTFGSETIGNTSVVSPDSGLDRPRYIANNPGIPPADTAVRVRITPVAGTKPATQADKNPPPAAPTGPAAQP
ncbi:MAG TPA: YdjY domain-containing protein [Phycisphaerales bacterium]|nr:YdjY domain-containing protein [Phycisphaerales bacterium]